MSTTSRLLPLAAIVALLAVPATANAHDHGPVATDHHTGAAGARLARLPVAW